MKRSLLLMAACAGAIAANAQQDISTQQVECNNYYATARHGANWFIQAGAGLRMPFVENTDCADGSGSGRHMTAVYNLDVGRWFTPYIGFRISTYYGAMHWNEGRMNSAKTANLNVDFMWDMFNSLGGYNANRVFSIVPFAGLGGTYVWDFRHPAGNIVNHKDKLKHQQWLLPVSAGLQFRFRLCEKFDFNIEGRASFYGDNFNNCAYGDPVDIDLSATAGFSWYFNGRGFSKVNPCDYLAYISSLNDQVNNLRSELYAANTAAAAALAAANNNQVTENVAVTEQAPLMSVVRFKINSARVSPEEMVNVYNMAQWLKANPNAKVIVRGYADRDTGTSEYNMKLSERRAQAVADILTNTYGIPASRLTLEAAGSNIQPYPDNNDWNRIVLFAQPE